MMLIRHRFGVLIPGLILLAAASVASPADSAKLANNRGMQMNYGPFLCYSVLKPGVAAAVATAETATTKGSAKTKTKAKKKLGDPNYPWKPEEMLAAKGITVRVGKDGAMVFDTDTCRYAAGWTGGFLDLTKCNMGQDKGSMPAFARGTLQFATKDGPGWATGGSFDDLRDGHRGPLPRDWARFKGIYRDGEHVVFSYTVGGSNVLDMPGKFDAAVHANGPGGPGKSVVAYSRTLRIEPGGPMQLAVCDVTDMVTGEASGSKAVVAGPDGVTCVGLVNAPAGADLSAAGGHIRVKLPAVAAPVVFEIVVARVPIAEESVVAEVVAAAGQPQDPSVHTHGGPALWKDPLVTAGTLGSDSQPYTVDTIKVPEQNPWNSWMRVTALDFFSDGRAAVCTFSGDVWVISNIDAKLDKVTWRRFAAGLYEPLGLRIVDDVVYVNCRDGLYRLHDLNGDGEADFYECFNNDTVCSGSYHAFEFDLQTDRAGNFYYAVTGNLEALTTKDHGVMLKVSKDGSKVETIATGFRAPNGMAVGPNDEIVIGDNQGNWTPSSKINWVKTGGFYGFEGDPRRFTEADFERMHSMHPRYDDPLCWIPYAWDNSSAGQLWVTGNKWGPLSGQMLHLSYGKCTMFEVMDENVDGVMQGGVVQLPLKFDSGLMRARMNPVDGQVYVVGMKGWQTSAGKSGCLQRVRYTGKPVHLPNELHVTEKGITIGFTCPLDPETANDPDSFSAEQFVYHWSRTYGSPEYKASAPDEEGHDMLKIVSAKLLPDKRSVLLEIPGLKRVDQMVIKLNLDAADGAKIKCEIGNTINKVGK